MKYIFHTIGIVAVVIAVFYAADFAFFLINQKDDIVMLTGICMLLIIMPAIYFLIYTLIKPFLTLIKKKS